MRADRFTGQTAFITGSAQGMGFQTALDMAKEGASVVISDVDEEALGQGAEILSRQGAAFLALKCDVSDPREVEAAVGKTLETFDRLDILINNAGILKNFPIEETTDELLRQTIGINVMGALYAIRAVTPAMKRRHYGRIINVSSICGKMGDHSTTYAYGASKGALLSVTRSVAYQLGPFGVTCNCIAPHAVMTKLMAYWDEGRKKDAAEKIPVRRLGTVEDMSHLMMFLASPEAGFINGENVNINGGYYMD
ncbi:MAG: glucose 1-dehydrogenase [Spirochaetales bacterium]|jgi:3-oxoacyl-[acyl-carrier protein] reductase|nr:glucose 1-dehydrogenase [Spirochaetales bacterium]